MAASTTSGSLNRKIYLNIVFPLFLVSVIAYIDRVNIGYAALTLNADLHFSPEVFGFGAGILFAGYLIFAIPGALIAEQTSARIWLACMMVCWGVISAMMAFMRTPLEFYVIRFLLGAAEASLYPVAYATFIPRWFRPRERALAIAVLLASLQVSGIIGAPLAGWMLGVTAFGFKGWQILFLIEAIPAVLIGLAIPFWMADWPRKASWLTEDEQALPTRRYEQEVAAKISVQPHKVLDALRDREVLKLCFIYFLWITSFWGFNYWMPTVLKSVSGWSNLFIGEVFAIAMAISLIFSIYIGHSSSKKNEKRWHGATPLFLAAVGMGISAYVHQPWAYFVFLVITAAGVYAPLSVWWSYPTVFLSGAAAAGAVGMINSMGNVGGFVGPYLTGWIRQTTGSFAVAMLYMAFSLAVAGLLILTLQKKLPVSSAEKSVAVTSQSIAEIQ